MENWYTTYLGLSMHTSSDELFWQESWVTSTHSIDMVTQLDRDTVT